MHVIDIIDTLSGNNNSVIHSCINTNKDIIFSHNPLSWTINQLHFTVNLLDGICTWVDVNQTRVYSFNILPETFINSNITLVYLDIWVLHTTNTGYVSSKAATALSTVI